MIKRKKGHKRVKVRNPIHREMIETTKPSRVEPKKGKGSYKRKKPKHWWEE